MTESAPFSRIVRVDAVPRGGHNMTIEASPSEREALAALYKVPAIAALTAALRLERAGQDGVRVSGAPEIVSQRIVGVPGRIPRQETEKRQAAEHHGGKNDQKDSRKHSRFS